jgi:hypothetical protein
MKPYLSLYCQLFTVNCKLAVSTLNFSLYHQVIQKKEFEHVRDLRPRPKRGFS